ncbi:MAG: hypothetical protein ACFFB2_16240 [Promethearchaeota archaeon]
MPDIEEVTKGFQLLYQFEEYQIRKSLGFMIIIIGVTNFIAAILQYILFYEPTDPFKALRIIGNLNLYYYLLLFSTIIPLLLCFFLTILTYFSVKKTTIDENGLHFHRYAFLGFALFFMYVFPSALILTPFSQFTVNYLWSGGLGCLISYYFLKKIVEFKNFKEILYLGLILIFFASVFMILYFFDELIDFNWILININFQGSYIPFNLGIISNLFIFLISYFICGYYLIKKAHLILERDSGFQE